MGVDVGDVRLLDVGGVEQQLAVAVGGVDADAVQLEQPAHDLDVGDLRDAAQPARLLGEDDGDHRLGDEVLGTPDLDVADEGCAAVDDESCGHGPQPNTDAARRRRLEPSPPRGVRGGLSGPGLTSPGLLGRAFLAGAFVAAGPSSPSPWSR